MRLPSSKHISKKTNDIYYRRKLLLYVTISSHTYAIYMKTEGSGVLIGFSRDLKLSTPVLRFKCVDRGLILSDHLPKTVLKQISH